MRDAVSDALQKYSALVVVHQENTEKLWQRAVKMESTKKKKDQSKVRYSALIVLDFVADNGRPFGCLRNI